MILTTSLERRQRIMSDSDDARRTSARTRNARAQQLTEVASRAQHLVDSRPPGPYQLKWCQEALYVGDLTALAAVSLRRPAGRAPESDRV
jgi:hypothetical protein